jgi:hypothetical protein
VTDATTIAPPIWAVDRRLPRIAYSDNALRQMKEALKTVDMDGVWAEHGPRGRRWARQTYSGRGRPTSGFWDFVWDFAARSGA